MLRGQSFFFRALCFESELHQVVFPSIGTVVAAFVVCPLKISRPREWTHAGLFINRLTVAVLRVFDFRMLGHIRPNRIASSNLFRYLRFVWRSNPRWSFASLIVLVVQGVLPLVTLSGAASVIQPDTTLYASSILY